MRPDSILSYEISYLDEFVVLGVLILVSNNLPPRDPFVTFYLAQFVDELDQTVRKKCYC